MLRKQIKIHHLNNRDQTSQNQKKYRNIHQEQYKTHNKTEKWYKEHIYLSRCGNQRNDDVFSVLLKKMLKKVTRNRKQALNVKVQQLT